MATINQSIVIIALPAIFRGIHLNPLVPANTSYLLWMLLGFMVVMAVLVVSLGRIGDMYGRVRMYNLGFAIFTVGSILLSATWMQGSAAAIWMIAMRVVQGIGAAFLIANSAAILTDAFPAEQRGLALGINMVAAIAGSFIGLVLGGVLAPISWRLVFLVSVPVGLFGTGVGLPDARGARDPRAGEDRLAREHHLRRRSDLAAGRDHVRDPSLRRTHDGLDGTRGDRGDRRRDPAAGAVRVIERRVPSPMFRLPLFRIRAFTAGSIAALLSALSRGGLMFMLILWLQGIWLPIHGYSFADTPLWAGISMLPLSVGFLVAGPLSGRLADRYGARPFATGGMILSAIGLLLLVALPVDFAYIWFGLVIFLIGFAMGLFAAPNQTGIMNSLPPDQRGAGAGMAATFMNSATVLSIGIFFSLIIVGLSSTLPAVLLHGLSSNGVPHAYAVKVSHLPAVGSLFAAFLGYNPMGTTLGAGAAPAPTRDRRLPDRPQVLPDARLAPVRDRDPRGVPASPPLCCALAAVASWMRGGKYYYAEPGEAEPIDAEIALAESGTLAGVAAPVDAGGLVAREPG